MQVRLTPHDDIAVLEFCSGEVLDCYVAADVKAQAFRLIEGRYDVVIDISSLEFVDSAGLGVLVGIYKRVKLRGRRAVIAGAQPYVARVMQIIKLDRVFDSYPNVSSAIAELSAGEVVGTAGR